MKSIMFMLLAIGTTTVLAANVLYCGGLNVQGQDLKVEPARPRD